MDMQSFIGSKFLGAADYPRPAVLTVEQVSEELIGEDKKRKGILYFERVEKALVLNKTNIANLIEIMGTPESDQWIGRQVEIYIDQNVMYAGKRMPALRLRAPQTRAAAAPAPQRPAPVQPQAQANPANLVTDDAQEIPDPGEPLRANQRPTRQF